MSDLRFRGVETDRLIVRPFVEADLGARIALSREAFGSDWPPEQWQRFHRWTMDSNDCFAWVDQPPYGDYAVALKATGDLIGTVGIVPALVPWSALDSPAPENTFVSPEFGLFWAVFSAHQGKGYATEAARAVVAYLFGPLNVRRIVATTGFDNAASQAVMRKLGMTLRRNESGQPPWCEVVGVLER